MWATWATAQPTLKIAANVLYPTVSKVDELVPISLQGTQLPKTDEKEIATKIDPPACHSLKCPKRSIWNRSSLFIYLPQNHAQQMLKKFSSWCVEIIIHGSCCFMGHTSSPAKIVVNPSANCPESMTAAASLQKVNYKVKCLKISWSFYFQAFSISIFLTTWENKHGWIQQSNILGRLYGMSSIRKLVGYVFS